jgi:predicted dehydrogenase
LVVGAGRMGGFHRTALHDHGFNVVTVDPDPRAGADYERVPGHRKWDVVCVSVPIRWLAETAAFWSGQCRLLLIEKPMAESAVQAWLLVRELRHQPAVVGYVERFNPQVRALRDLSPEGLSFAVFKRWNTRKSRDVAVDVQTHDIDLARFLNVRSAQYDTRAGAPELVREIWTMIDDRVILVDLTAHKQSPLHDQWGDAIAGGLDCARPEDALGVLEDLQHRQDKVAA